MANPAYDIYEPLAGGFRARLSTSLVSSLTKGGLGPLGVGFDTDGRLEVGNGNTGIIGVLVKNVARGSVAQYATTILGTPNPYAPIGVQAGDAVDVMTNGTIVNLDPQNFPAGTRFYSTPLGEIVDDADPGNTPIGFTREAGTLIVRCANGVAVPTP